MKGKWRWQTGGRIAVFFTVIFSLLVLPYISQLMDAPTAVEHKIEGTRAQIMVTNEALAVLQSDGAPEYVTERLENEKQLLENLKKQLEHGWHRSAVMEEAALAQSHLIGLRTTNPHSPMIQQQELKVAELEYFVEHTGTKRIDITYTDRLPLLNYLANIFNKIPGGVFFLSCGLFMANCFTKGQFNGQWRQWEKRQLSQWEGSLQRRRFKMILILCLTVIAVAFMAVSLFVIINDGLGAWQYPLFYRDHQEKIQQMSVSAYLGRSGLSIVMGIFFLGAVSSVLVRFTRNFLLQSVILCGLLLPSLFPELHGLLDVRIAQFLPMSYLDLPKLILMENPWNSSLVSWEKGLLVFFVLLVLLLLLANFKDRQEQLVFAPVKEKFNRKTLQ